MILADDIWNIIYTIYRFKSVPIMMIVNVFTIDISTVNGGYTPTENPISRGFMTHALNELMGIPVQNIYIYPTLCYHCALFNQWKGCTILSDYGQDTASSIWWKFGPTPVGDMKLHEITNHEILNSDFVPNIWEYHLQWSWEVDMMNINRYCSNQLGLRIMPPAGHSGAFRKRLYPNASRIRTF